MDYPDYNKKKKGKPSFGMFNPDDCDAIGIFGAQILYYLSAKFTTKKRIIQRCAYFTCRYFLFYGIMK